MSHQGNCALCGTHGALLKSHVIPKFVVDWMKKTGATDYIRHAKNPNLRHQDIEKMRLLCLDCEVRLSKWEKLFAEQIYAPFQQTNLQAFDYDKWLLYFAVSLSWRTVRRTFDLFRSQAPHLIGFVEEADACWRDFLLERRADAGPYDQHMFFFDFLSGADNVNVPDKMHAYTLGGVDSTLVYSDEEVWAYTKLPGLVFWAGIQPPKPQGWQGTLIADQGHISSPQLVEQPEFGAFWEERVKLTSELFAKTSDVQRQKIRQTALASPERLLKSKSFKIFLADSAWQEVQEN